MKTQWILLIFLILESLLFAQNLSSEYEFQVNTTIKSGQESPCITTLVDGRFVICWSSWNQDGSEYGILGQIFDENSCKIGNEFQINTFSDFTQNYPAVSSLRDGGFVVCWAGIELEGNYFDMFAQRFDMDGNKIDQEFKVNTYTKNHQQFPCITSLKDGGFVVCWQSRGQDNSCDGIWGKRFDRWVKPSSKEFQINTFTELYQQFPKVASLTDGGFIVCWQSDGKDRYSPRMIKAQRFDEFNNRFCEEFQVNETSLLHPSQPCVSGLVNGGFVISWKSFSNENYKSGIYAKQFDEKSDTWGDEFRVDFYTDYSQVAPCITAKNNGNFVICWQNVNLVGAIWQAGCIFIPSTLGITTRAKRWYW